MKVLSVILKSIREQVRSYWILLLSLAMGPFFIFVYYLIVESSKPGYHLVVVNMDQGAVINDKQVNFGKEAIDFFAVTVGDSLPIPLVVEEIDDEAQASGLLKNKKADALIVIPADFSSAISDRNINDTSSIPVRLSGDLTSAGYLVTAIFSNEVLNEFIRQQTGETSLLKLDEIALGVSGSIDEFDMIVPGILIVSLIMLMFTASIAFVSEVENKTIMRLKLSKITALEFLAGIGAVQALVGVVSVVLTLLTAVSLGFEFQGSLMIMLLIAALTSLSIIAFSLIIAAVTKSANEVLIVGNFPMFLFMFFTGAAFPMKTEALFSVAGYPVSVQGLMTPVHAISALNKTLVMNMDFKSIIPELTAIVLLSFIYFIAGALIFKRRHLTTS